MESAACSFCTVLLGSSKRTKVIDIVELLEILLEQLNLKLLEELLICDTCLTKVQSAYEFKTTYLGNTQKLCIQEDVQNETVCEICRESVDSVDCIPLFYSATEFDKLNLIKFLSSELQLKSQDSPQTCELCYKSILNFCSVIKLFSVFIQKNSNETATVNDLVEKADSDQERIIVNSVDSTDDHRVNIKEEVAEDCEQTITYDDFLCKNEELDLKEENEQFWNLNCEDQEEKSSLPCPENLRVPANNSDLAVSIPEIEVDYKKYSNNLKSEKNDENKVTTLKCQHCPYQAKRKSNFNRHALVHEHIKMFKCNNCEYQAKCEAYLKKHMLIHKNINEITMFKCQNCPYQSKYKHHLNMHVLIHKNVNEVEMFKCHNCQYQTKRKDLLKNHVLTHKDAMFKCQNCEFQTKRKKSLQRHMLIHNDTNENKMFKCQICPYKAIRKDHFQRHMIIHSDVEMFKCQNCQYRTRHKGCLKKHVVIHQDKEAKMLKCQDCHYQTHCKYRLKQHNISIHKNINEIEMFKCYHCDFQTKYKTYLRVHVLNHNKIKLFKCQNCEYQTKYKQCFKKHCLVHDDRS